MTGTRALLGRLRTHETFADRLLAGALAVGLALELNLTSKHQGPWWGNVLGAIGLSAPLVWRRLAPVAAIAGFMAAAVVQTALFTEVPESGVVILNVLLVHYSVGAYTETRPALAGLAIGLGGIVLVSVLFDPSDILFPLVVFGALPWLAGRAVNNRTRLTRELQERTERLEREREGRARAAAARERSRLARELHDVIAHNVSVMVIQAGAARRIAERDPDRAEEAARLIESTGREALAELRRTLGMLRRSDEDIALAAKPSLVRVGTLLLGAQRAGLSASLKVEGTPRPLPPGLDLAAYRIVQEALTNVIEHAGPANATVVVRYRREDVELEISDDGAGAAGAATNGVAVGHGLVGMRERVALYGGELQAGPRSEGGFTVRARLPYAGAGE
jgi:signal transduction histidine kinase